MCGGGQSRGEIETFTFGGGEGQILVMTLVKSQPQCVLRVGGAEEEVHQHQQEMSTRNERHTACIELVVVGEC